MAAPPRVDLVIDQLREQLDPVGRSWVKLRTLGDLAGRKRMTEGLIVQIEEALKAAGIHHLPHDLTKCRPSDTVRLATSPIRDPGLPFDSEKDLARFIAARYRYFKPFARCTSVTREARHWLDGREVRVDLLFRDYNGDRIVCELEHYTGGYETGSQIVTYVSAVSESLGDEAKPSRIRGVVITGSPNPEQEEFLAKWSAKSGHPVEWYYYRLLLDLEDAPTNLVSTSRATSSILPVSGKRSPAATLSTG